MRDITLVAAWELRAAIRTRWILSAGAAFAVSCLAVSLLGLQTLREMGLSGVGPAYAGLLGLAMLLPPLIGLMLGAGSVAGARERGVLAMMAVQPVTRGSLVIGIFAGLTAATWTILALGFGTAGLILAAVARPDDIAPLAAMAGATLAVTTVSVALGVALSSAARIRAQATAWAVVVWFVLALGIDLALAGLVPALKLGPGGLLAAIILNPIESGRVLALLGSSADGSALGSFGAYVTSRYGALGASGILVGGLITWGALALLAARTLLTRRDI